MGNDVFFNSFVTKSLHPIDGEQRFFEGYLTVQVKDKQGEITIVDELIKVAKEPIVDSDDDISADRLKNAAATKKLAIFDAFEILNRIQEEEQLLEGKAPEERKEKVFKGFAEGRSK